MKEMTQVIQEHSTAYAEIINLIELAEHHRRVCRNENCIVSIYLLRKTINRALPFVWPSEKQDIILKIDGTKWI